MAGNAWMNPMNKIAFQKAIRDRKALATIGGVVYRFDYGKRPGYVWIQTTAAFIPAGWFELGRVLDKHWIEDVNV